MGKLLLETVMVAVVPTHPVVGVKLTPGQPLGPQPPPSTDVGKAIVVSNDTKAAHSNSLI